MMPDRTRLASLRPHERLRLAALLGVLAVAAVSLTPAALAQDDPAPDQTDILRANPYDRITLVDATVVLVDPVSPRPLPVVDPVKEREKQRRRRDRTELLLEGNIIPGKETKLDNGEEEPPDPALEKIRIHTLKAGEGEVRDFEVKRSDIKKVDYFEDILLAESERYVLAHDFPRAFECCLWVRSRDPRWPGLEDHVNQVLYAEGSRALIDGDAERGQRLLRELLVRKPDYPGLLDVLGDAYAKRINRAIELGMYMKGRRILGELESFAHEATVVKDMRRRFLGRANEAIRAGEGKDEISQLDASTEALRIWPSLDGVEPRYKDLFAKQPTLEVAVTDVPDPLGPFIHSPADARSSRLLYLPLLEADDEPARQGKRQRQLAASIETTDLGRRMLIKVKPGVPWSDGTRSVSAVDLARDLTDRTDPNSPRYIARWGELLDRVEATDELRLEVRLNRPPLRSGPWFLGPVAAAHAGVDGREASSNPNRPWVCDGMYLAARAAADRVELRARNPRGGIRRIIEIRQNGPAAGLAALRRGDVSLLEHVPPDQAPSLSREPGIKVGAYARPTIHMIAIDGRNPKLRSRALRRGISYAIDRKGLLEDFILKHPIDDQNRPADGPFPAGSYADAPKVKPLDYHPMLAKMLVAAARRELGGDLIRLKLEYPPRAEARTVVIRLAKACQDAGFSLDLVEVPESRLESELRAGRRFELAYRALQVEEPVTDAGPLIIPGYDAPSQTDAIGSAASPRILQLLLALERTVDWPSARGLATQIDRESRDELPVIPLWQIQDHYAWRDRLTGPSLTADRLYDGIENWQIAPWIARDPEPAK